MSAVGIPFLAFAGLIAATALMRLVEIVISARRIRRRPAALVAEPRLFPLMVLLHVGFLLAPPIEVLALGRPFVPGLAAVAGTCFLLATALRVWTLRTIGGAWNVRVVRPADGAIVSHGPYAWIRHPNYLVVVLEIASLPLLHTAWISSVVLSVLNGFVLYHRIRVEEAALAELPAWREAMSDRPRLIPGLARRRRSP